MKRYPLELTEEQHKQIRIKAAEAGKSMKEFILDCVSLPSKQEFIAECKIDGTSMVYNFKKFCWEKKESSKHKCKHGNQRNGKERICGCK